MRTEQTMTTEDWMALLRADAARLQGQDWRLTRTGLLRNNLDECPLCALANLQLGPGESHYKGAFVQALRLAFGAGVSIAEAEEIAIAADNSWARVNSALRAELIALLVLPEGGKA